MADARDRETRKADTLTMLATPAIDVWVATRRPAARRTSCRCRSRGSTNGS